jgi:hypothetical protein
MPHMLDVGVCSTGHIASFWGIAEAVKTRKAHAAKVAPATAHAARAKPATPPLRAAARPRPIPVQADASGVKKVIEDALRAAGLMR